MNIRGRHALRLIGIGAFAIAIPQFASASDSTDGAALKLAMGPTSAAQKNQSAQATSDTPVPTPRPRAKHKHKKMAH
jgi:hypothetical protein